MSPRSAGLIACWTAGLTVIILIKSGQKPEDIYKLCKMDKGRENHMKSPAGLLIQHLPWNDYADQVSSTSVGWGSFLRKSFRFAEQIVSYDSKIIEAFTVWRPQNSILTIGATRYYTSLKPNKTVRISGQRVSFASMALHDSC